MNQKGLSGKIKAWAATLQRYVDRPWLPFLLAFFAFIDVYVIAIPTDGLMISSTMLRPKKWFTLGFAVSLGSTLGLLTLALLVHHYGLPLVLRLYPGIDHSPTWITTSEFFVKYGLLLVFLIGATPIFQQPSIILATLAGHSILLIGLYMFVGRTLKFLLFTYLASHAPKLLLRVWPGLADLGEVQLPPKK
jgi:membrane protein YqaA with SNARE-associated domain